MANGEAEEGPHDSPSQPEELPADHRPCICASHDSDKPEDVEDCYPRVSESRKHDLMIDFDGLTDKREADG